jgi:tripartite-type tricarboxylate transporter receptor subunit TctC
VSQFGRRQQNKAGASGVIGIREVVRAPADGHTLGYAPVGSLAINQSLLGINLTYDADKQLVGLALLGRVQNALVVRPDLPVKPVAELIAYAKERPGKLSMGSAGVGTTVTWAASCSRKWRACSWCMCLIAAARKPFKI